MRLKVEVWIYEPAAVRAHAELRGRPGRAGVRDARLSISLPQGGDLEITCPAEEAHEAALLFEQIAQRFTRLGIEWAQKHGPAGPERRARR